MFDEYKYPLPLKEAAEILAKYEGWPRLYDKTALQVNAVPCAAIIYYNDMYVERPRGASVESNCGSPTNTSMTVCTLTRKNCSSAYWTCFTEKPSALVEDKSRDYSIRTFA